MTRRRIIAIVAIVAGIYLLTQTDLVRIDLDPDAREQANAASADALWHAVPASAHERQRWTILKQADWFSWGQKRTTVGRRYDPSSDVQADLDAWIPSATAAGWHTLSRSCPDPYDSSVSITFSKMIARWWARLEIAYERYSNTIKVNITMDQPASSSALCRPTTTEPVPVSVSVSTSTTSS
jgi:hypothetical protein